MAAWPRARASAAAPPSTALLAPLLLLLAMLAAGSEACTVDECSQKYGEALSAAPAVGPAHAQRLCAVLARYRECVHGRAAACHGNLGYHSALTIVRRRMQAHGCVPAHHATRRPQPTLPPALPTVGLPDEDTDPGAGSDPLPVVPPEVVVAPPPVDAECDYRGPSDHVHCGLFGDPHLKTFAGQYQTCRVEGAWPLIDNAHLAVQVTNKPVLNGSRATATTKVTVIVRGAGPGAPACARHRKTYEATAEAALPATFVDGTQRSAGGAVQLAVHEAGRRVEISVRHVDALVVVRRAGRYLAFSARLPRHLALGPGERAGRPSSGLQLCARGCPASELLHPLEDRGSAMKQEDAEAVCGASNLTGSYHDWCVFDVMTTGADDFADAAHAALTDVRRLDPLSAPSTASSSSGATTRGGREQRSGSGAASLGGWLRTALAAAALLLLAV